MGKTDRAKWREMLEEDYWSDSERALLKKMIEADKRGDEEELGRLSSEWREPWVKGLKGYKKVPNFIPRECELRELIAYWTRDVLTTDFWMLFVYQTSGIEDIDHVYWAEARVGEIMKFLGEKETKEIIERTKQEYRESLPPEYRKYWDIFSHGTREERKAAQFEIRERTESGDLTDPDTTAYGLITIAAEQLHTFSSPDEFIQQMEELAEKKKKGFEVKFEDDDTPIN